MTDPRVNLRNPIVAAVLAYLIPGAGHFYQRRFFKAAIYFVCVLGVFFWGCSLGEAKAVHLRWDKQARPGQTRQRTLGYLAQVGVGTPALAALVQHQRYKGQLDAREEGDYAPNEIIESFDTEFSGRLMHSKIGHGSVTGRLVGELRVGDYGYSRVFEGTLQGAMENGDPVEVTLVGTAGGFEIGPRICGLDNVTIAPLGGGAAEPQYAADRRRFSCHIEGDDEHYGSTNEIEGTIPRSFANHFQVPLSDEALQHLNGTLGKRYELALVYTWIAGLLNLLAVWDAAAGPAYGYGDEEEEEKGENSSASAESPSSESSPAPANA